VTFVIGLYIKIMKKVEDFFTKYREQKAQKGHLLVMAGNDPEGIYYLTEGEIGQYDISESGQKVMVNIFRTNAFFPMSWAINKTPNEYFFEALSDIKYKVAPPDKAVELLKANPDVLFDLLARVYRGTDGMLRRTSYLMGGKALNRLGFELIVECKRGKHITQNGQCLIKLSETDLAMRSGMTRETVNRQIQKFKADNLVSVSPDGIRILDIEAFESAVL